MNRILLLIIFSLYCSVSYSQMPEHKWAKSSEGEYDDYSSGVTTDQFGNIICIGTFHSPTITFGNISLSNEEAVSGSLSGDIFLVKMNTWGGILWAKSINGDSNEYGKDIYVDSSGNITVTGKYMSSFITFGSDTLFNLGVSNIFIAKYDSNGNFLFAEDAFNTPFNTDNAIAFDKNQNNILMGSFQSDTLIFSTDTLINSGLLDIYLVKNDSNGNELWAKRIGGEGVDFGSSITTDSKGNIFITGYFESPYILFANDTIINSGSMDAFIAKYDANGHPVWIRRISGDSYDFASSISVDSNDHLFVTGRYDSQFIVFGSDTLFSNGNGDIFVLMFDINGNYLWSTSMGGTEYDCGTALKSDNKDNLIITGTFHSPFINIGNSQLTNPNSQNHVGEVYISKLSICGISIKNQPQNQILNVGQKAKFSISANQNFAEYQWQSDIGFGFQNLTNAGQYRGANSDTLIVNNLSLMNDNQMFRCILSSSSCRLSITSDVVTLTVNSANGLNSLSNPKLEIIPNPTLNSISVKGLTNNYYTAEIYSIQGQLIRNAEIINYNEIDLSDLSPGIYILKINDVTDRIIKF